MLEPLPGDMMTPKMDRANHGGAVPRWCGVVRGGLREHADVRGGARTQPSPGVRAHHRASAGGTLTTTAPFGFSAPSDTSFLTRQVAAVQQTFPGWVVRAVISRRGVRWTARPHRTLTDTETSLGLLPVISATSIQGLTQTLSGQVEIRHDHCWKL